MLTLRLNKTRLNFILILLVYFSYRNNDINRSPCRHISIISDIIVTIGISSISEHDILVDRIMIEFIFVMIGSNPAMVNQLSDNPPNHGDRKSNV